MMEPIKVKYRSVFKYDNHQETIKFDTNGYLKTTSNGKMISFKGDKEIKIEIMLDKVILHSGKSMLHLVLNDEIVNEYETDYGVVLLKTKLISYQYENPLKLRYELYDGNNLISSVYLMVSYLQLEN